MVEGKTRRRTLHESGSLRVRFPSPESEALSAVFINTAGGIAGGDHFAIDIAAGEGTRLVATTAAAEKIYRSHGPDSRIDVALKVGDGAHLAWLPQETILFDGVCAARTHRRRSRCHGVAGAVRDRRVRPRRDERDAASGPLSRPLARPPRRQAGVRRNRAARWRHRRDARAVCCRQWRARRSAPR